jgi:REP element-mobilizing transposase RayT
MTLFKNKYRIESARLQGWNYTTPGYYFVTICTKHKRHFFGKIRNGVMYFSPIGRIAADELRRTAIMRDHVVLDAWVIMPDHIHGIIGITNDDEPPVVETHCDAPLPKRLRSCDNLSNIIRGFKSSVTKRVRMAGHRDFAWQTRFYDRIIRDENALNRVRIYIKNNPAKWRQR